jgi:hypothetical protein
MAAEDCLPGQSELLAATTDRIITVMERARRENRIFTNIPYIHSPGLDMLAQELATPRIRCHDQATSDNIGNGWTYHTGAHSCTYEHVNEPGKSPHTIVQIYPRAVIITERPFYDGRIECTLETCSDYVNRLCDALKPNGVSHTGPRGYAFFQVTFYFADMHANMVEFDRQFDILDAVISFPPRIIEHIKRLAAYSDDDRAKALR